MQLKDIAVYFLFLFGGNYTSSDETMTWSESRQLTWADFKATPDKNSEAVALTASGITFGYSVKTSNGRIIDFSYSAEAHFYPKKSWYVKGKGNAYILKHEQLHFDITELYVRKFRQHLETLVANQNIKKQINQIHVAINEALDKTQKNYDSQTNHSINAEAQKYWQGFIKEELNQLDKFKSQ